MIVVKEKKPVPHDDIRCGNCGSLLQYGNADLLEDYSRDSANYGTLYGAGQNYYFNCPVCGCKVRACWIMKKGEEV